eukprot:jgi/Tetstr1/429648/TSEL_019545.t1
MGRATGGCGRPEGPPRGYVTATRGEAGEARHPVVPTGLWSGHVLNRIHLAVRPYRGPSQFVTQRTLRDPRLEGGRGATAESSPRCARRAMVGKGGRFGDADLLGPQPYPVSMKGREAHVYQVENLTFRADFDSANLKSVAGLNGSNKEFELHTLHDCDGTPFQTSHRSWFYFSVSGHKPGDHLVFNVMNLNKQAKLFQNDFRPVFRTFATEGDDWERIRFPCSYQTVDGDFQLRFRHKFDSAEETFFAYTYPNSYEDVQAMLERIGECFDVSLEDKLGGLGLAEALSAEPSFSEPGGAPQPPGPGRGAAAEQQAARREAAAARRGAERAAFERAKGSVYYRRQLLGLSLQGRRVDLLTITDQANVGDGAEEEERPPDCFPSASEPRCHAFPGKKVVFISARVHPGETPGSHLFNGLLAFLLRPTDARAAALRSMFVFKLVPLLNPDGVANGHYRCDTLGRNLNRFYLGTTKAEHPTIHCVSQLLQHCHAAGRLAFYLDLHAHANKRGVFAYGNALEGEEHIDTLAFCKLVALNNAHFEFEACNFTEKNMQLRDKNGDSKEGSGRVALFQQTGLTHIYTIEANYCCSRIMNQTPPASNVQEGRVSPPNRARASPKYSPALLHGTGRALVIGILDLFDGNPWSRLPESPYASLEGVRSWVKACLAARQDSVFVDSDNSSTRDSPALPRGASFKKAGDIIDDCKAEKVFAEVEKRRRASSMKRSLSSNTANAVKAAEVRRTSSMSSGSGAAPAWNSRKARNPAAAKSSGRAPLPRSGSARRPPRGGGNGGSGGGEDASIERRRSSSSNSAGAPPLPAAVRQPRSTPAPASPDRPPAPSSEMPRLHQCKSVAPVSLEWHDPASTAGHRVASFPSGRVLHESTGGGAAAPTGKLVSDAVPATLPMLAQASQPPAESAADTYPVGSHAARGSGRHPAPAPGLMLSGMLKGRSVSKAEGARQQHLPGRPLAGGAGGRMHDRAMFVPVEAE